MTEQETYDIYYDEAGDFLEVTFGVPPETEHSEEIEPGVFITRDEVSEEIKGIGILGFKKRVEILKRILDRFNKRLPIEVSIAK
tara:strand:- start:876 stop:1127 length:252 start_codon:yes stop_codon:yes gene_type:complete